MVTSGAGTTRRRPAGQSRLALSQARGNALTEDAATHGQPEGDVSRRDAVAAFLRQRMAEAAVSGASEGSFADWKLTVNVVAEPGDSRCELMLTISELKHGTPPSAIGADGTLSFDPGAVAFAKDLMACIAGVAPTSWQVAPRRPGLCIHTQVDVGSVADLLATSEASALADSAQTDSAHTDEERPSHIVRETELVQSLVDGHVVRSMCGQTFVPTETGAKARERSVCPRCVLVVTLAKRVVEPPR